MLILRIVIKMSTDRTSGQAEKAGRGLRPGSGRSALAAHIASRGLKHSRQRELVAEAFFGLGGHVAVDELIGHVHALDPHISVATVYRTMKLLAECGLAVPRQFEGGQTRYEPGAGRPHHDHLICTGCGHIIEFEDQEIERLQEKAAKDHRFRIEHHSLRIYGKCAKCAAPAKRSSK